MSAKCVFYYIKVISNMSCWHLIGWMVVSCISKTMTHWLTQPFNKQLLYLQKKEQDPIFTYIFFFQMKSVKDPGLCHRGSQTFHTNVESDLETVLSK